MNPQWGGGRGGSYPTPLPCTAPLRPVLCSVPGDLKEEWLFLENKVFPEINMLCQARGTCFTPVDVQWDDQASHLPSVPALYRHPLSSLQLKVSLDLITLSSSFFCLLGHRYGPCRSEDSPRLPDTGPAREAHSGIDQNLSVAAEGGYPWVLTGRHQTSSLTELQVTQAALMGDKRRCFFYFRDYSLQGDEEEEQRRSLLSVFSRSREYERCRVRALKDRIVDSLHPVRFFRTLPDLGVLVLRDWKGLVEHLYGPQLVQHSISSGHHQDCLERRHHEGAVHDLCRWFVPSHQTAAMLEALNAFTLYLAGDPSQSAGLSPRRPALELTP